MNIPGFEHDTKEEILRTMRVEEVLKEELTSKGYSEEMISIILRTISLFTIDLYNKRGKNGGKIKEDEWRNLLEEALSKINNEVTLSRNMINFSDGVAGLIMDTEDELGIVNALPPDDQGTNAIIEQRAETIQNIMEQFASTIFSYPTPAETETSESSSNE